MTTSNDLLRASATELAGLLRAGDVSATELTTDALERIEDMNSDLNAICHLAADEALEAAAAADRQLATGDPADLPAFFGVPTLIKELSFVEGWPVCGASLAVDYPPASTDEVVVARWRDAGFVFLGSSTSPEFGALATTESLRHGATRNPWDLSRVSGGSSGGAATAVSSGMVSIAHGNDGGGSVRAPASFTGLVGLKPSRGRIPGSDGIGAEGALTRTIEDTAAALDFMTGPPTPPFHAPPSYVTTYREAIATPPGRLRIGVTTAMTFPSELTQDAVDAVGTATRLLEGLGHHVSEVPGLPVDPEWFTRTFHKLWAPSGTAGVRFVDESALGVSNQEQLRRARAMNASEYAAAMDEAGAVASAVTRGWGADFDVLVTPTNPFVAPRVGWLTERESEDPWSAIERSAKIATFTAVCNLVGVPAISLPLHQTSDGLPLGVQLIGPPWRDDLLLALAAELEAAAPWRDRTPTTPFRTTGDPS